MGLNEDLAGVTLLAFGNGSPDIFTALADYEGDTEMLYAELFGKLVYTLTILKLRNCNPAIIRIQGAAIFIIGIIAAVIMIVHPFTVNVTSFIRDVTFFLFACWWIASAFRHQKFTMLDAVGMCALWLPRLS